MSSYRNRTSELSTTADKALLLVGAVLAAAAFLTGYGVLLHTFMNG
ncbi:hypothetical protein [Roseobacter ponti]|uniref:Uncharacterized protein n=1 Tax=Roseobacter ponti TaxID=1891787 RepID=A0A858SU54_9RHOB|nr:hypothetical protein [Roseobacter ponti]QJF51840.1 hypothetical protein G3256_12035 [Roseobacter ponti]